MSETFNYEDLFKIQSDNPELDVLYRNDLLEATRLSHEFASRYTESLWKYLSQRASQNNQSGVCFNVQNDTASK